MAHVEVYYTPPENIDSTTGILKITGQEAHHLRTVVRHASGDKVIVVDGCGKAYWVILSIGHQGIITGAIEKEEPGWGESKITTGVIIPPLKGHRMDTVIEKGTELGVCSFNIPNTENAVAQVTESKLERWHRIALSAMKQCCRSVCPTVQPFTDLEKALQASVLSNDSFDSNRDRRQCQTGRLTPQIILYADIGRPALSKSMLPESLFQENSKLDVVMVIGPEGGFSDDEIAMLNNYKGIPFGLGERRLRSDTAVIAALVQINALL